LCRARSDGVCLPRAEQPVEDGDPEAAGADAPPARAKKNGKAKKKS